MEDKSLFRLALIGAIIGIFIIFIVGEKVQLADSNISEISKSNLDENVKVKGKVNNFRETSGLYILDISDNTGEIQVIVFKNENEELDIKEGNLIEVNGVVSEYEGMMQINANLIKLV